MRRRGLTAGVAMCVAVGISACGPDEAGVQGGQPDRARLGEHHFLGEPVTVENLTVWPVVTDQPLEIGEYLTLGEAQSRNLAVVRELGAGVPALPAGLGEPLNEHERARIAALRELMRDSTRAGPSEPGAELPSLFRASGVVGSLVIENTSDLPVLVCAGTVVTGGNQDRQIAQDFVIEPKSSVPVEAFCVEQGRWVASRGGAPTRGFFTMAPRLAPRGVRASGQYEKNQHKVWQEVARINHVRAASKLHGTSLALSMEAPDATARVRDERVKAEVRKHFAAAREQGPAPIGFAYAIDGRPVTVRTFAHSRLFENYFEAFLGAMCMEADVAQGRAQTSASAKTRRNQATAKDMIELVGAIERYREELRETSAANRNGYRRGARGFQASCYVQVADREIALTQDWTAR